MTKADHRYVFIDNQRLEKSVEYVSARSLYGSGIFTTLAVYDTEPFLWEKHWKRLVDNATRTGIDLSEFSEDTTRNKLSDLVEANEAKNGRVRITFFDESVSELWPVGSERRTSLLMISADFRRLRGAVRLTVSPYPINSASPLAGVKSCNYLEKMLAKSEGKQRGFDEAVQLNERGQIASACMANIFWSRDGRLFTPSLNTGCLPGTTREFILENMDCEEVEAGIEELNLADQIFLTSAGLGVVQAAEFDGRPLSNARHAITELLPSRI